MSLLLEALKKAEKAKEEAQRRAEAGSEAERSELRLEGEAAPAGAAERKAVITRDKLPDISTPLEIVSDDLKTPTAEGEPASAPPRRRDPESAAAPQAAERATARKVFEAKFREPNPRIPFYITMGSLGTFAVGTVVYFYLQLRPPPPLVNANPPRASAEVAVQSTVEPVPAASVPVGASQAIPGLPPTAAATPSATPAPLAPPTAAKPAAAPRAAVEEAPERPRLRPQPARVQATPPAERAPIAAPVAAPASRPEPQVSPRIEAAYGAFLSGDAAAARKEYQQALTDDPGNRDALLGIAALDVRAGRYELAESAYLRLLQANPKDSAVNAALVALRSGRLDPLVAESRLKTLIAADPAAHALNFALGNQYAQQGRWAEAQQEFFKAAAAEPENADYAYNLAVSLDHLRQPRPARDAYQRAVTLAERRGGSFDLAAARARLAQLSR